MNQITATILLAAGAGALLGALGLYVVAFSVRKKSEAEAIQQKEELRGQFAAVSADVFRAATDQFLKLAESRLETERVRVNADVEESRRAVESSVEGLKERLGAYEVLVRSFETDRERKYGSLEEQLRKAAQTTEGLRAATERLHSALSNARTRGQWGERMAEDILRAAGLLENVQYLKNRAQDTSNTRPDFTFFLPDGCKLHMDVKFPLDNYLRKIEARSEEETARYQSDFLRDVRARIKELSKRDYIKTGEGTLGYVLLFIPNEQVYSFVLESEPGIVDEALEQKVVLTSPFSLYAVLSIIRQSFENFHFTKATQEVVQHVRAFSEAYQKFKERFARLGEQLERTVSAYQEITGPSYKRLDQAVARIEAVRRGTAESEGESKNPIPEGDEVPS